MAFSTSKTAWTQTDDAYGSMSRDRPPKIQKTNLDTVAEQVSSLPPTPESMAFFRNRILQYEKEQEAFKKKLEKYMKISDDRHVLEMELLKRGDKIAALQKALSHLQSVVYEERQRILKLENEVQKHKAKEEECRIRIQELLRITENTPLRDTIVYTFRQPYPLGIYQRLIESREDEELQRRQQESALHSTDEELRKAISSEAESSTVNLLRKQISDLQVRLEEQSKLTNEQVEAMTKDCNLSLKEAEVQSQQLKDRIVSQADKLKESDEQLKKANEELLSARNRTRWLEIFVQTQLTSIKEITENTTAATTTERLASTILEKVNSGLSHLRLRGESSNTIPTAFSSESLQPTRRSGNFMEEGFLEISTERPPCRPRNAGAKKESDPPEPVITIQLTDPKVPSFIHSDDFKSAHEMLPKEPNHLNHSQSTGQFIYARPVPASRSRSACSPEKRPVAVRSNSVASAFENARKERENYASRHPAQQSSHPGRSVSFSGARRPKLSGSVNSSGPSKSDSTIRPRPSSAGLFAVQKPPGKQVSKPNNRAALEKTMPVRNAKDMNVKPKNSGSTDKVKRSFPSVASGHEIDQNKSEISDESEAIRVALSNMLRQLSSPPLVGNSALTRRGSKDVDKTKRPKTTGGTTSEMPQKRDTVTQTTTDTTGCRHTVTGYIPCKHSSNATHVKLVHTAASVSAPAVVKSNDSAAWPLENNSARSQENSVPDVQTAYSSFTQSKPVKDTGHVSKQPARTKSPKDILLPKHNSENNLKQASAVLSQISRSAESFAEKSASEVRVTEASVMPTKLALPSASRDLIERLSHGATAPTNGRPAQQKPLPVSSNHGTSGASASENSALRKQSHPLLVPQYLSAEQPEYCDVQEYIPNSAEYAKAKKSLTLPCDRPSVFRTAPVQRGEQHLIRSADDRKRTATTSASSLLTAVEQKTSECVLYPEKVPSVIMEQAVLNKYDPSTVMVSATASRQDPCGTYVIRRAGSGDSMSVKRNLVNRHVEGGLFGSSQVFSAEQGSAPGASEKGTQTLVSGRCCDSLSSGGDGLSPNYSDILHLISHKYCEEEIASLRKQLKEQRAENQELRHQYDNERFYMRECQAQCRRLEEGLKFEREHRDAYIRPYEEQNSQLIEQVKLSRSQLQRLDRYRRLEVEGFRTDIKNLTEKIKNIEKQIMKALILFENGNKDLDLLKAVHRGTRRSERVTNEIKRLKAKLYQIENDIRNI